ncbi:MAG: glycosyltransferase [Streptosporangiales bacterium]|nr:glycosyltransferase [Streptosporangiales bacterium]
MKPTVTVVVPTRNRPHLLREALASIAAQDLPPGGVEATVVNDGGVDVTAVINDATARGLPVRVLTIPRRRGLPAARNLGIDAARGEFVAFLDDDDIFLPSHLRVALTTLKSEGVDAVYTSCLVSTRRLQPGRQPPADAAAYFYDFPFSSDLLSVSNYIPVHAPVLRNPRSRGARFDASLSALEDWDMWLRLTQEYRFRVLHVPEVTVAYHRIPGQASMTAGAAARAATLARFASEQRRIWARWPAAGPRAARFRLYLGVMYWHALALHATGKPVSRFYYHRTMRAIFAAWSGAGPEDELIDRIAVAVEEDIDAANVA